MKPVILIFMTLCLPLPVAASHTWSGIDLCEVYEDKLPPGLTAESLPDPQSPGAGLLNQYCTQCHNLPGPDRHTAAEWREVTSNMFLLMDVSHRFGGLMGRVEIMQKQEQEMLVRYLQRHAMRSVDKKTSAEKVHHWLTPVLVLGPFLLLVGVGMLRWWKSYHKNRKPCVID